ncbi:hypothetical protein ACFL6C_11125 [Myxococcota bacterium]
MMSEICLEASSVVEKVDTGTRESSFQRVIKDVVKEHKWWVHKFDIQLNHCHEPINDHEASRILREFGKRGDLTDATVDTAGRSQIVRFTLTCSFWCNNDRMEKFADDCLCDAQRFTRSLESSSFVFDSDLMKRTTTTPTWSHVDQLS